MLAFPLTFFFESRQKAKRRGKRAAERAANCRGRFSLSAPVIIIFPLSAPPFLLVQGTRKKSFFFLSLFLISSFPHGCCAAAAVGAQCTAQRLFGDIYSHRAVA